MTKVYICAKYDDKVIHSRQIEMKEKHANEVVDLIAKQIDGMADTLLKADKMSLR